MNNNVDFWLHSPQQHRKSNSIPHYTTHTHTHAQMMDEFIKHFQNRNNTLIGMDFDLQWQIKHLVEIFD